MLPRRPTNQPSSTAGHAPDAASPRGRESRGPGAAAEDINRWLVEGRLKPRIDRVLPLSQTAEAHRIQEEATIGQSGQLSGKLVLKPDLTP